MTVCELCEFIFANYLVDLQENTLFLEKRVTACWRWYQELPRPGKDAGDYATVCGKNDPRRSAALGQKLVARIAGMCQVEFTRNNWPQSLLSELA